MDPTMMQQAQQMMSNPAMAQQAMSQMENMSADDVKSRLNQLPAATAAAATAEPATVLGKLKASAMEVPDELLDLVEEAEGAKAQGNTKFRSSEHAAAALQYQHGCTLVERALKKGLLSGADKKAVQELKDACHLNLANCQLKLGDWAAVAQECDEVLERGASRKALFRRGQARRTNYYGYAQYGCTDYGYSYCGYSCLSAAARHASSRSGMRRRWLT